MTTMRAVQVTETGDPGVMVEGRVPRPDPWVGEVRVRVRAAGINPVDVGSRRGGVFGSTVPFIPGWDISGVVDAVGPGVTIWRAGDPVFGLLPFPRGAGAYAEFAIAPARSLARVPAGLSHVEAAALPLAGLTAWQALVDTAGIAAGARVAITAAAGGVGHLAVQIAAARGAEVIAVASRGHAERLAALGARTLVEPDAADADAALRDLDAVLDCVGGDYPVRGVEWLRAGGTLVTLQPSAAAGAQVRAGERDVRALGLLVEADGAGMRELVALVEAGLLAPTVAAVHPLAEASEAQLAPHGPGKVVLTLE
ncbi:NADP-dependent oxidoreductase [Microbacterium sp. NPDC091313]